MSPELKNIVLATDLAMLALCSKKLADRASAYWNLVALVGETEALKMVESAKAKADDIVAKRAA